MIQSPASVVSCIKMKVLLSSNVPQPFDGVIVLHLVRAALNCVVLGWWFWDASALNIFPTFLPNFFHHYVNPVERRDQVSQRRL
jgi:hypothetical protein